MRGEGEAGEEVLEDELDVLGGEVRDRDLGHGFEAEPAGGRGVTARDLDPQPLEDDVGLVHRLGHVGDVAGRLVGA